MRCVSFQIDRSTVGKDFTTILQHTNFNHQFFWWAYILWVAIHVRNRTWSNHQQHTDRSQYRGTASRRTRTRTTTYTTHSIQHQPHHLLLSNPILWSFDIFLKYCCKHRCILFPQPTFGFPFLPETHVPLPIVPIQCGVPFHGCTRPHIFCFFALLPNVHSQLPLVFCLACPRLHPMIQWFHCNMFWFLPRLDEVVPTEQEWQGKVVGKEKEKEKEEGLLCLNFVAGLENGKHTKARTFENALTLYGGSQLLLWSSVISSRPCCPQQNDVIGFFVSVGGTCGGCSALFGL